MKRVFTVLTLLAMVLVAGAIPGLSEASSSDIIIEDDFEIYSVVVPTFPTGWERLFAAEREPANNRVTDATSYSPPNSFQVAGSKTINLAAEALYKLDATPAVIFLEVMVQASGDIKKYDKHQSDIWVGFVTRNVNVITNRVALSFNKDGYIYGTGAGALKEYTENEWCKIRIGLDYTEFEVVRANYWIDGAHMCEVALSGPYRDYLEVGSGAGGKGWIDDIKVWTKGNEKPVAEAGDNVTYTLEVSQPTIEVTLNGSNSTDSDGTIAAYTWTGTPDPDDAVDPTVTLGAGIHTFTLVVTDDDGAMSDPDTVTITVNEAPNQSPIADAGPDATYILGVSQPTIDVTLNGSNSTDSDGTITAYTWTGTPDPDDVVNPTVTLGAGVYTFTLVVTDDDDAVSDPDTVTVTVNEAISECEFQTFIISHMTIDWAKNKDKQDNKWKWGSWFKWFTRSTPKKDDTFSIKGRIRSPEGCTVADLEESAVVGVSITGGSGKDTVSFRERSLGKWGAMWWYRGSVQPPGRCMNITKMTIWWTPQSGEWAGWARFNIDGVLELPEDIEMNTTRAEATVTVRILVNVDGDCGSLLGEETVEFKVSSNSKSNRWYY